jgi:UDP-N-acetylglucosamine 4,6-dehydratase (inverting)
MKNELENKSLLVTGGTGSLGNAVLEYVIKNNIKLRRLIIFSRDEQKHFRMMQRFPITKYPFLRFFIGDVRDKDRLIRAFEDVEIVIHAAAMKHVHLAEYNPLECIHTNINGAENVIEAALFHKVESVIALSTDKACAPINLYGATKLTSDKLFVSANFSKGKRPTKFSVVRYGNVMGSNGSVMPFFKSIKGNTLPITDFRMTRFNISLEEGVEMIFFAILNSQGGEVFVPKIPSYRIIDVAKAINPEAELIEVGIRPGEKLHEEMITETDSLNTYDIGKYYAILPHEDVFNLLNFVDVHKAIKVREGFSYNSGSNDNFESIESLKKKINKHVN